MSKLDDLRRLRETRLAEAEKPRARAKAARAVPDAVREPSGDARPKDAGVVRDVVRSAPSGPGVQQRRGTEEAAFDRVAYQREYMRKWRKRKKEKQANAAQD